MKLEMMTVTGIIGGLTVRLFGGWDMFLATLVLFMIADYLSGVIVALWFKKSDKSKNGKFESGASYKGLLRKGMILVIVMCAHQLDLMAVWGADFIRNGVIFCYIINELASIIENAGRMGVPVPDKLTRIIAAFKKKSEQESISIVRKADNKE